MDKLLNKRYVIRFKHNYGYKYLTKVSYNHQVYINRYFNYSLNAANTYKTVKNAFNRLRKLEFNSLNDFQIVEVIVTKKRFRPGDTLILTDNVYEYKGLSLFYKLKNLRNERSR